MICSPKSSAKNTAIFEGVKMSGKEPGHEEIAVHPGADYFCPETS